MKRALFITPRIASSESSGGLQVTEERLAELRKHYDVTVLTLGGDSECTNATVNGNVLSAGTLRSRTPSALLQAIIAGLPLSVWRNSVPEFIELGRRAAKVEWDLLYLDHWLVAEVGKSIRARVKVLHLHNAEPELFFRASDSLRGPRRITAKLEGWRAAKYLRVITPTFNELHLLSGEDYRALKARGIFNARTEVFFPRVSAPDTPVTEENRASTLFVGSLSWLPNSQGLLWYLKEVRHRLPSSHLTVIAGGGAPESLKRNCLQQPNTKLLGYVEDLEPLYRHARCLIAPLLTGSGIKIKIVNALARGIPVVTTPIGAEGFPDGYGEAISVCKDSIAFANRIEEICKLDQTAWRSLSDTAQRYATKHFDGSRWQMWVAKNAASGQDEPKQVLTG